MRRILIAFAVIVVLLPVTALGGAFAWVLVPLLVASALALREALQLRRAARRDAAARER